MARVIGEASIRLTIDGANLGASMKRAFRTAAKEASSGGLFDVVDRDSDRVSKNVESRFGGAFSRLTGIGQKFGSALAGAVGAGSKLVLIGTAAGAAIAGVGALTSGVLGLGAALIQASGAAALLPAALIAVQAISATVKLGVQGMSDAFKALGSGDTQALNEAMKKLAPSAREVVSAAQQLKPAFDKLQLNVQQNLFSGLGTRVRDLGTRYMPILRTGLSGIATELNGAGKGLLDFANDGEVAGQVSSIFDNIRATVHNLAPSLANVASALLDVGHVGAGFLPGLAQGFTNLTAKFADFIRESAASGNLQQFIQNAINTLKQLGDIAKNVGGILSDLFGAAQDAGGGGFLNTLQQATAAIRQFTSSAEGHQALVSMFQAVGAAVSAILPIITGLASIVGTTLAPVLLQLVQVVGPALQGVLGPLGAAIQAAAPGLLALGQGFAAMVAGIAPALPAIGQLVAVLGNGLGQVMATLGPVIGQFASVLAGTLAQAIPPLVPIITQLVKVIGDILTAVAPLIGPILQLVGAALQPLITIVQALVPPFQTLINAVLKALQPILPVIAQAFSQVGTALAPLAGALGQAIVQIFTALLPVLQPLIQVVLSLVQAFLPLIPPITTIIQILSPIIALFAQIAASIIGFIASAIQPLIAIFGVVNSVIGGVMNFVLSIISGVISTITGIFSGFLSLVGSVWNGITSTISGAVSKVGTFISNGFNAAVNFVKNAFNNIVSAVGNGISNAVSFVGSLPGKILSALGNFGSLLFNVGRDLLQGLINGIGSMVKWVLDKVKSIGSSILNGIKSFLGINSPSREMAKIGVFVGEGLIKGMDSMTGKVEASAAAMGGTALSAATAPINGLSVPVTNAAAAKAAGAAPGGQLIQNNYMLPGTDVKQFADTVLSRADTDLASNASTFSVGRQGVQLGVNDNFLAGVGM